MDQTGRRFSSTTQSRVLRFHVGLGAMASLDYFPAFLDFVSLATVQHAEFLVVEVSEREREIPRNLEKHLLVSG